MSQGLTWIAGRRIPLLALVALFALTVGLFMALPRAGAQAVNYCSESGTILQGTPGTCDIDVPEPAGTVTYTVVSDDSDVASVGDRDGDTDRFTVTAVEEGNAIVTVTKADSDDADAGSETEYPINVVATMSLSLGDSDNVFSAPADLDVTITVNHKAAATFVDWVRVSGTLSVRNGEPTGEANGLAGVDEINDDNIKIIIPAGSTEGEYTVSAQLSNRPTANGEIPDTNGFSRVIELDFTVGDAGAGVATVDLALGVKDDNGTADPSDDVAENGSAGAAAGTIKLVVQGFNALGNKANDGDISTISVIAANGSIDLTPDDDTDEPTPNTLSFTQTTDVPVGQKVNLKIGKANGKPGTVDVYVFLSGTGGAATSDTLTLTFTGNAAALTVGDASNVGPEGMTEFNIDAADAGGNVAGLGSLAFKVTDADGNGVPRAKISPSLGAKGDSTPTDDTDDKASQDAIIVETDGAATGDYTIEVSLIGVKDSAASTTITVVGGVADITVAADPDSSDAIGDIITVTATVSDEDGNAVVDGTEVDFDVSGNTGLSGIGKGHADGQVMKTVDGSTSVKYAVVGAGTSVISASTGGATGVAVITSTAGTDAAVDEPDPEPADGLSQTELNNFASWSGEGSVSASELLAGIADASGVLFYDGDSWQRYGVVDGQVIPGSRDFTIRGGQTIWISG